MGGRLAPAAVDCRVADERTSRGPGGETERAAHGGPRISAARAGRASIGFAAPKPATAVAQSARAAVPPVMSGITARRRVADLDDATQADDGDHPIAGGRVMWVIASVAPRANGRERPSPAWRDDNRGQLLQPVAVGVRDRLQRLVELGRGWCTRVPAVGFGQHSCGGQSVEAWLGPAAWAAQRVADLIDAPGARTVVLQQHEQVELTDGVHVLREQPERSPRECP